MNEVMQPVRRTQTEFLGLVNSRRATPAVSPTSEVADGCNDHDVDRLPSSRTLFGEPYGQQIDLEIGRVGREL
jgi:hypothetical protein